MLKQLLLLRTQKNLSQASLAKEIGVSQKSIDNWESGISQPSIVYVARIADYFECSIDYLLGREDDYGNIALPNEHGESERLLLRYFKQCAPKEKEAVLLFAEYAANKRESTK